MRHGTEVKCCILLLLDGLGDRSYAPLGHKTPLQRANTPNLDRIATLGANGIFHPYRPGVPLPSELAHFLMFGYKIGAFPGRGYLEALGAGIELNETDVAILAHFVSVSQRDGKLILEQDKPRADEREIHGLLASLRPMQVHGLTVRFYQTKGLYGIIRISGDASPRITDTHPMLESMPIIEPEPLSRTQSPKKAASTAMALKQFQLNTYALLKEHPVNKKRAQESKAPLNFIVTNRPSQRTNIIPFQQVWGLNGASISSGFMYKGLARFIGLDHISPKTISDISSDIHYKMAMALELSDDYDFIHVHTKAPDEAAHTKDPIKKVHAIESLDEGLRDALDEIIARKDILLVVTSDHSTPSTGPLIHSGEAVPIVLYGPHIRRDRVRRFSEVHAPLGSVGMIRGREFMFTILNSMDRAKLKGLMDTPLDQPFWPGQRNPFLLDDGA